MQRSAHLEAVLLSQDAGVHGFDDGVLIQSEVQRLGGAAGRQQGLMGVGLFEALHQTGPGRRDSCGYMWRKKDEKEEEEARSLLLVFFF